MLVAVALLVWQIIYKRLVFDLLFKEQISLQQNPQILKKLSKQSCFLLVEDPEKTN